MEIPNNLKMVGDYCRHKGWSNNTIKVYLSALTSMLVYFKSAKDHEHISDAMLSDYLLTIPGRSSRCTAHSVSKLFFYLKGQPNKLKFIPYPEKEEKLPIHVNKEEFLKMIQVCENEKHRVIICLMFDCGLRVSEVVNLRLTDIDRSNMLINVIQAKGRKDRKVKLTNIMLMLIDSYLTSYKPEIWLLNGQQPKGTTAITQYTTRSCEAVVQQLKEKAGITKDFTPHKFRHGFAMNLLENGTDLERIKDLLGHKSTKTTRIYARMNNNVIQATESPLEQILKSTGTNLLPSADNLT